MARSSSCFRPSLLGSSDAVGPGRPSPSSFVRLGVRSLVLLDDDKVVASNLTRLYGSTPAEVGEPKVDAVSDHLLRIAPDLKVETHQARVTDEAAARSLTGCDVVFGCTDDNAGRLVLSRLSSLYLVPLVDCGVLISSSDGAIQSIYGHVTVQVPGSACLVCRGRVDIGPGRRRAAPKRGAQGQAGGGVRTRTEWYRARRRDLYVRGRKPSRD